MSKIIVPSVGESITEGVVSAWLKQDGDFVQSGEPLYELETDKITTEVPADGSGVVKIGTPAGSTVKIGSEIGSIEPSAGGSARPQPAAPASQPAAAAPKAAAPVFAKPPTAPTQAAAPAKASPMTEGLPPSMRRKLQEKQLTPSQLVPALANTSAASTVQAAGARETRKRMSTLRQRIAERLVVSQHERASLTTFNEADLSGIMDLREKYKDAFKERHGVGLGIMSFFVKSAVAALKAIPQVNARIEGADIVYNNFYDIGIAVSTDRGLVVPVLRDADKLSFAEIEKNIADLAVRARDGKIGIEELQGGTFTITNGGVFGSLLATPIINPPQSAILGMHTVKKRPVVVGDQIVARPMMYIALTYDHRIIDGKESVTFLVKVKEYLENPGKFLLDIA